MADIDNDTPARIRSARVIVNPPGRNFVILIALPTLAEEVQLHGDSDAAACNRLAGPVTRHRAAIIPRMAMPFCGAHVVQRACAP